MSEIVRLFTAEEAVSRENFNARLEEINQGAAAAGHSHLAGDVTGGVLPVERGGTGAGSLAEVTVGRASRLAAARSVSLTGDMTGTATFDGTADCELKAALRSRTFNNEYKSGYRTKTKGDAQPGGYLAAVTNGSSGAADAPQYGPGLAWGVETTHGYLMTSYNNPQAYLGAGNADQLNWVKQLAFADHTHSAAEITTGALPVERGGTGAATAAQAIKNLRGVSDATVYYNAESAMSADNLLDSLALIPISSTVNPALCDLLSGQFAYVLTLFHGTPALDARRMQLAFSFWADPMKAAMRCYTGAGGWTGWVSQADGGNAETVDGYHVWKGTQAQYDALSGKSDTTLYLIVG